MTDWYVAPYGLKTNLGTLGAPWDIESALMAYTTVKPGDTIFLRGGTYHYPNRSPNSKGYRFYLLGSESLPITIRPYEMERATIDGGLKAHGTPMHLRIRDLEIIVSENLTEPRVSSQAGSAPTDLDRPWGGIDVSYGHDIKLINNVIHANSQGIAIWQSVSGESELYGNLIYDNGWIGPDRYHGPGIYGQNSSPDWKFIQDNVVFDNYSYNMQLTGKNPEISRFEVARNFFYKTKPFSSRNGVIIGAYSSTLSHDGRVLDNVHYASGLDVGHNGGIDDAVVKGNTIVKGRLTFKGENLDAKDNFVWEEGWDSPRINGGLLAIPTWPMVALHRNRYDPNRANLAVMVFQGQAHVEVEMSSFLEFGDTFELKDPSDFYGDSVVLGTYEDQPVTVPMAGEFAAFVILRTKGLPPDPPIDPPSECCDLTEVTDGLETINAKLAELTAKVDTINKKLLLLDSRVKTLNYRVTNAALAVIGEP